RSSRCTRSSLHCRLSCRESSGASGSSRRAPGLRGPRSSSRPAHRARSRLERSSAYFVPYDADRVVFFSLSSWALALIIFAVVGAATGAGLLLGRRWREHHATLKEPFG